MQAQEIDMRLPGSTGQRENLVVAVTGFEEKGKGTEVGVRGTDPATQQEKVVFLTTEGAEADNPRRISLAKFRDGYRVQRQTFQLREGGVIAFSRATCVGEGEYEAPWPEVLAYDRDSAKEMLRRFEHGMIVMADNPQPERSPGDLFVFRPKAGFRVSGPDAVAVGVAGVFAKTPVRGHTLLIFTGGGEKSLTVMPRALVTKDGDQWRPMDADEAANWARGYTGMLAKKQPGCHFGVIPVETYRLSKLLEPEKFRVPAMAYYREDADGNKTCGTRVTYVKLSGMPEDEERFVNSFFVEGPYGQRGGTDPASLLPR